jgi:hypothetical protein
MRAGAEAGWFRMTGLPRALRQAGRALARTQDPTPCRSPNDSETSSTRSPCRVIRRSRLSPLHLVHNLKAVHPHRLRLPAQEAGFEISEALIACDASFSYGRAFVVGLLEHLFVSAVAIVTATVLGLAWASRGSRPTGCCASWPASTSRRSATCR